jgi:dTDP-4-dehydrorhamnose 3,5-epimerase
MKSNLPGVVLFPLSKFNDERGWLIELFRNDWLYPENFPAMAYVSETKPGVVRGPHEHREQTDYFAFVGPSDFKLYLWDNRDTKHQKETFVMGENNPCAIIVPPGVVHAYKNIGDVNGWVFNGPNQLYAGPGKKYPVDEIRHEDLVDTKYHIE